MIHVSLAPDILFHIGALPVTNTFLTSFIFLILSVIIGILFITKQNDKNSTLVFMINFCLTKLHEMFSPILKDKTNVFFPFLGALFLFVLFSNWLGLLPGMGSLMIDVHHHNVPLLKAATADLNTTLGLALVTVLLIQYSGLKYLGFKDYISKFINFKSPVDFFTGILEIISEVSKIISFAFRLFGNIFAGEVLIAVIAFLIPVLASFPFLLLEVFVGFIQALVFSMLAAVFINLAVTKHH